MSINRHAGNPAPPRVVSPETMYEAIRELGIVPFFENPVPGYSVEERTPKEYWFEGDELGPWDWKIFAVQSGDIAYGKFLWGGKAAFATVEWYRELMNWRRSLPRYQPVPEGRQVLDYLARYGTIGIKEVRGLLGVKKNVADNVIMRLQMATRVVTGDIQRVYRGPDLHYNGWQTSSFCTPEALFETAEGLPGPGGFPFVETVSLQVAHTPEESLSRLMEHVREIAPEATEKQILKMLA